MNASQISTYSSNLFDSDTTSLTAANLLIYANVALEEIVAKLVTIDQYWLYGDENYTAEATYVQNLVNGQRPYDLPRTSGLNTFINILQVEVLDNSSNWHKLEPITLDEMGSAAQLEFNETSGRPQYYEKRDTFVYLYPPPDNGVSVTLTNGLRILGQRAASVFTDMTSTTEFPGFAVGYHVLLAYKSVLLYALSYKQERVPYIMSEINRLEKELITFYAEKSRDRHPRLQVEPTSFR